MFWDFLASKAMIYLREFLRKRDVLTPRTLHSVCNLLYHKISTKKTYVIWHVTSQYRISCYYRYL